MTIHRNCPVCLSEEAQIRDVFIRSEYLVECPICGRFSLERNAYEDFLDPEQSIGRNLLSIHRARMSHRIRNALSLEESKTPTITSEFIERFKDDGFPGPNPAEQATNAVRYVGDHVSKTGERLNLLPIDFFAVIGAANNQMAADLLAQMKTDGLVTCTVWKSEYSYEAMGVEDINLTLAGWKSYEEEKRGRFSGRYGFLALKFHDLVLDQFATQVIKPTIRDQLQYELVDMRDVARAGLIDNIMRAQIRDSAFVIVDLTHDNSGAYWEAGYAEGLGKPVIYICEKCKFEDVRTHFDTNHCTTVTWSTDESQLFKQELVATLRRSLNLF